MYATFDCTVSIVDEKRREAISKELYERRKADIGDTTAHIADGAESEDEDLLGYDAVEPGLPAASSDRQKWWLDNRQPAKANVQMPNGRNGQPMVLNPNRPSNPFGATNEPDWVSVPRPSASPSPSASIVSGSPYGRTSVRRSQSAASNASSGRRLPPPFDPSKLPAKVGQHAAISEDGPPPPPPPRRATAGMSATNTSAESRGQPHSQALPPRPGSSASQASRASSQAKTSATKSPPPPVAKKPAHLAGSSPVMRSTSTQQPARKPVAGSGLPRRPVQDAGNRDAGPVDLLDSGGDEEVGGWQTLQPSK